VVRAGEVVNPGDVLLEIQTDKATIDVESNEGGVLAKILVRPRTEAMQRLRRASTQRRAFRSVLLPSRRCRRVRRR